jgi:hypothetical protein
MNPAVLTLMLAAPGPYGADEASEARAARLETIARAVELETASPPPGWRWASRELAAAVLATTYEEGHHWSRDVHEGERTGDSGRARCLGQLHRHHRWMPRKLWLASTGTDLEATRVCVRGVVTVLSHYAATCVSEWRAASDLEGSLARVNAGYGTGASCSPTGRPWATRRARLAVRWLRLLEQAERTAA